MQILLVFMLCFSLIGHSAEQDCHSAVIPEVLESAQIVGLVNVSDKIKSDFKRRPMAISGYQLALSIETNFEAPLIGRDIYWGQIYFNDNDPDKISYRDDLIAERYYKHEQIKPTSFWKSDYDISDINSAKGLSLIKAGGAEVNVQSVGPAFTTRNGGRLSVKVKAPKTPELNLVMSVNRNGSQISKSLIIGNKQIPFDSFKINADSGSIGVSILNGIKDVQFFKNGKLVHAIIP